MALDSLDKRKKNKTKNKKKQTCDNELAVLADMEYASHWHETFWKSSMVLSQCTTG
jgi:hypothetical protein